MVATSAVVASTAAVTALHGLRPDLDPVSHRLSEYAVGPWGWVMTAAFVGFASGVWALRRSLAAAPTRHGGLRLLRTPLGVAVAGLILSAFFETDATTPGALRETVHSAASSAAFGALVLAALGTSTIGRAAVTSRNLRLALDASAVVVVVGAAVSPAAHDGPWTGAVQRLSYLAIVAWLVLLTRAIRYRP